MNDFTQMHVFFAVTTAAVILITAFMCGVLVYLARLLRTLQRIASEVEEEAEEIRADLSTLREDVKSGFRLVPFLTFFSKSAKRLAPKKSPRKRLQKSEDE